MEELCEYGDDHEGLPHECPYQELVLGNESKFRCQCCLDCLRECEGRAEESLDAEESTEIF